MEEDDPAGLGQRFARLAADVEAVLRHIREREARAERLSDLAYSPTTPHNIFKQIPGRPDFEYIKVPKKPPELCFGSKTERKVFPDVPEILKRGSTPGRIINLNKSSWRSTRRTSSRNVTPIKDGLPQNTTS